MTQSQIWELIGYAGSLLVVISLLMTSIIKLRVLNTLGSLIFCVYALVIHSYPTAAMNAALVIINIVFLRKALRAKAFMMVEASASDAALDALIKLHEEDIETFFPGWKSRLNEVTRAFFQFHGDNLAGMTLLTGDNNNANLLVDYSTPGYRDFKLGAFVYEQLKESGITALSYDGNNKVHIEYLKKMGFSASEKGYSKKL